MPAGARLEAMLNVHGQGRCAITLDPQDRLPGQQPYQGVVPLHGDQREPLQQLSQVLEHYMLQSEQLDTRLVLAANDEVAAGLLIQRLPVEGEGNLAGAAQRGRDRPATRHFNRIAHAGRHADARGAADAGRRHACCAACSGRRRCAASSRGAPRFACTCSRERVRGMLRGLGREESRQHHRRARRGRGGLRVLRPAVPLRRGRRGRDVHARARPAAHAAPVQ